MSDSDYLDREQTEIKHFAIRLYLEAAARIIGSAWNFLYVDCCSGPWNSTAPDYSDTSFGIALSVLRKASKELSIRRTPLKASCLFIEKNASFFTKLKLFVDSEGTTSLPLRAENWDFVEHVAEIRKACSSPRTFSFVLIDPWGWKLAGISQIAPLLKMKPGEVVINLMSSFITRFVNDHATDLSDLLGADFPELRSLRGTELEFAIVRRYCDRVKQEGSFKYVCALPVMKADSDAISFYLIYATRHIKGVKVFKNVEFRTEGRTHIVRAVVQQEDRQTKSRNLELFEPSTLYRERRYSVLAYENKRRAKEAVFELVRSKKLVKYEECWAEALQLTAVYEADLRQWISEWELKKLVSVTGRQFPGEVLKAEAEHYLTLKNLE